MRIDDGLPAGIAIGVITTTGFFWLLDPTISPIISNEAVGFVTIGATLFAAAIAYGGVLRQLRFQRELDDVARQKDLEAERAALPLALSRICEISMRGMQDSAGHETVHGELANEDTRLETVHTESIKAIIKVSEPAVSERLQAILRGYQLAAVNVISDSHTDLVRSPGKQSADGSNRIAACYRWALLYVLSESLFRFARGGNVELDMTFVTERLRTAVWISRIMPERYTGFEEFLARAAERRSKEPISDWFLDY